MSDRDFLYMFFCIAVLAIGVGICRFLPPSLDDPFGVWTSTNTQLSGANAAATK